MSAWPPTVAERLAILAELIPQLPLAEPRPRFAPRGRGAPIVPSVHDLVGWHNQDLVSQYARKLDLDEDAVHEQFREPGAPPLPTPAVLPPERMHSFDAPDDAHDSERDDIAWWSLPLPLLKRDRNAALILAQLGGHMGAADFEWWARREDGRWLWTP